MENKTLIYETQTRLDTTYTLDSNNYYLTYQVDVMNLNEMVSSSNKLINDNNYFSSIELFSISPSIIAFSTMPAFSRILFSNSLAMEGFSFKNALTFSLP